MRNLKARKVQVISVLTSIAILATLAALTASGQTARVKSLYRTFRFSAAEIGITCTNGADPTGRKMGDILVISCTDERKEGTVFGPK